MRNVRGLAALVVLWLTAALVVGVPSVGLADGNCSTSDQGGYSVTVCLTPLPTQPVSGDVHVAASVSQTGGGPGVQRVRFYMDGAYLLTAFSPPYGFELPTWAFADGQVVIQAEAQMRDGFQPGRASGTLTMSNGNAVAPLPPTGFTSTTGRPAGPDENFVVAAVGDGADGGAGTQAVSDQAARFDPNMFLYLGDVYEKGRITEFLNWYGVPNETLFGRLYDRTNPVVGNHEYEGGDAPGYRGYWATPPDYYSVDSHGWHLIALNSTGEFNQMGPGSPQYQWLLDDLAQNSSACTLAYFHHPRWSIGAQGNTGRTDPVWQVLADAGVDIVLTGHDHNYQRWQPLDRNGEVTQSGITQFVVGTGGHGVQGFTRSDSRIAASQASEQGVLRLELNGSGAAYRTEGTTSGAVLDSGSVACSGAPADTAPPSTPNGLVAAVRGAQVDLRWGAAVDDVGVVGYNVYRDGTLVAETGPRPLFTDESAAPNTAYAYRIVARDGAGHLSPASATTLVSTLTETTVFADGFETGDLRRWTFATGDNSVGSQAAFSGQRGVRIAAAGGPASYMYTQLPLPMSTVTWRTNFRLDAQGSTVYLGKLRTAAHASVLGMYVASNGRLSLRNDVLGTSRSSTTMVSAGVWHTLSVTLSINGSGSTLQTLLDGAPVNDLSLTENFGTTAIQRLQLGDNSNGRNYTMAVDAAAVDSAPIPDTSAPLSAGLVVSEASEYTHYAGSTLTYNPNGPGGSFTVEADVSDPESGISSVVFPAAFNRPLIVDAGSPYQTQYSWSSGTTSPTGLTVWATNGAGLSTSGQMGITADSESPSGGSITYPTGYVAAPSITVQLDEGQDAGAGVNTDADSLDRADAPLVDGQCGIFGSYAAVTDLPDLTYEDESVESGACYRYRFTVIDHVGNLTTYTHAATAMVDAIPPTVSLDGLAPTVSGTQTLEATADDLGGSGLNGVTFSYAIAGSSTWNDLGTISESPFHLDWDTTTTPDGQYDLRAVATDRAGNLRQTVEQVVIDNNASLSVLLTEPRGIIGGSATDPATVRASSPDTPSLVEFFRCSDTSPVCATGVWSYLGSDADAPYTASWAIDVDGNRSLRVVAYNDLAEPEAEDIVDVTVDRTPPSGGSVGYVNGYVTSPNVAVATAAGSDAGTGIDASSGRIQRQQSALSATGCAQPFGPWTDVGSPDSTVVSATCYAYRYQVDDLAGNTATYGSAAVAMVDTSAPSAPSSLSAGPVTHTQVDLHWTPASDDVAVVSHEVLRDGVRLATLPATSGGYSDQGVSPGQSYSYVVRASDAAGNTASSSLAVTTPAAPPTSATFGVQADAYVTQSAQNVNYGAIKTLRTDTSPDTRSYLRFTVAGMGGSITQAIVHITPNSSLAAGFEVRGVVDTGWAEMGLTYANAPPVYDYLGSSGPVVAGNEVAIDVSGWVTNNGTYSLALTPLSSTSLALRSREGGGGARLAVSSTG